MANRPHVYEILEEEMVAGILMKVHSQKNLSEVENYWNRNELKISRLTPDLKKDS